MCVSVCVCDLQELGFNKRVQSISKKVCVHMLENISSLFPYSGHYLPFGTTSIMPDLIIAISLGVLPTFAGNTLSLDQDYYSSLDITLLSWDSLF